MFRRKNLKKKVVSLMVTLSVVLGLLPQGGVTVAYAKDAPCVDGTEIRYHNTGGDGGHKSVHALDNSWKYDAFCMNRHFSMDSSNTVTAGGKAMSYREFFNVTNTNSSNPKLVYMIQDNKNLPNTNSYPYTYTVASREDDLRAQLKRALYYGYVGRKADLGLTNNDEWYEATQIAVWQICHYGEKYMTWSSELQNVSMPFYGSDQVKAAALKLLQNYVFAMKGADEGYAYVYPESGIPINLYAAVSPNTIGGVKAQNLIFGELNDNTTPEPTSTPVSSEEPTPVETHAEGSVRIKKTKEDGSILSGATLEIRLNKADGPVIKTLENFSGDEVISGLMPGKYYLVETKAPEEKYEIAEPKPFNVVANQQAMLDEEAKYVGKTVATNDHPNRGASSFAIYQGDTLIAESMCVEPNKTYLSTVGQELTLVMEDDYKLINDDTKAKIKRIVNAYVNDKSTLYSKLGKASFEDAGLWFATTAAIQTILGSNELSNVGNSNDYGNVSALANYLVTIAKENTVVEGKLAFFVTDNDAQNQVIMNLYGDDVVMVDKEKTIEYKGTIKTTVSVNNQVASKDNPVQLTVQEISKAVKVVDTIHYEGMQPNKEYKVTGTLMQVNEDGSTKAVAGPQEKTCIANAEGKGDWTVEFNNVKLEAGKTYVVFEKAASVEKPNEDHAEHEDKNDKSQTIIVGELEPTQVKIVANKELAGEGKPTLASVAGKFTFHLSNAAEQTQTNNAQGKVEFDAVKLSEAKTYRFTISEEAGTDPLVTYHEGPRHIDVITKLDGNKIVIDGVKMGDGTVVRSIEMNNGIATITLPTTHPFTNTYKKPEVIKVKLVAEKELAGAAPAMAEVAGQFEFKLNGPSSQTKYNDEEGKVIFDEVTLDEAKNYAFKISETQGDNELITYFSGTRTINVKTKLEGDHYVIESVTMGDGTKVEIPEAVDGVVTIALPKTHTFVNTYNEKPVPTITNTTAKANDQAGAVEVKDGEKVVLTDIVEIDNLEENKEYTLEWTVYQDGNESFKGSQTINSSPITVTLGEVDTTGNYSVKTVLKDGEEIVSEHNGNLDVESETVKVTVEKPIQIQVVAQKELAGKDAPKLEEVAGQFNFTLTGVKPTLNATNAADGTVTFDAITLDQAKTYKLEIRETKGNNNMIDYHSGSRNLTIVTEKKANGEIGIKSINMGNGAPVTINEADNGVVKVVLPETHPFTNTYQDEPVPTVETIAKAETNKLYPSTNQKIVDTVNMTNLIVGREYTLSGKVMIQSTEQEATSFKAEPITFVAQAAEETKEMTFVGDATDLGNESLVVFETLTWEINAVTEEVKHDDIHDEKQTVEVYKEMPTVLTTAEVNGSKVLQAEANQAVVDTVTLTNLKEGVTYTLTGKLMIKEDNAEVNVYDAETVTFTATKADEEAAEVTKTVTFTNIDASELGDKHLVVFETLTWEGDAHGDENEVKHENINDADQTVLVDSPEEPEVFNGEILTTVKVNGKQASKDAPVTLTAKEVEGKVT
ncbi:MAG: VaFE repeat-containing surface-anchored protein, partial [Solobacterium sp.]|nr:VaFE repeat-containing surface-anchored protein [Solobacterium sp.]